MTPLLTDNEIVGFVADSVVLLKAIQARLKASLMADGTYTPPQILNAIETLKRKARNVTHRKISDFTYKAEPEVTSEQTDAEIVTNISLVLTKLRQVIARLKVSLMEDFSYSLEDMKHAVNILANKEAPINPTAIIDEYTVDVQQRTQYVSANLDF
jgi:hypothetical protein